MKARRGFTLIELVVVMAIFGLALGFVFYDFRAADRRASLRRSVQQVVERLQEMRTWSVANRQPSSLYWSGSGPVPTRVTTYGARFNVDDPASPIIQYSWAQDTAPGIFLWDQSAQIEPQLPFTSQLKPWDTDIRIKQFRFFQDTPAGVLGAVWRETQVGFPVPQGAPLVKFGANQDGIGLGKYDLFIYFEHQQFPGRCWELIIHSAGDISAREASC